MFVDHGEGKRQSVDVPSRTMPSLSVFFPESRQRMSVRHDIKS